MLADTGHKHRAVYAAIGHIYRASTAHPPRTWYEGDVRG